MGQMARKVTYPQKVQGKCALEIGCLEAVRKKRIDLRHDPRVFSQPTQVTGN
jgi:hypothetical protein